MRDRGSRATIRAVPPSRRPPHPMKKRVVRAEEFEVVDEHGHVRMRVGVASDDEPFFSMLDDQGQVRARFGLPPRVA